jgi:hypothetical protein
MNVSVADELLEAISELRVLFPDWRIGQLVSNLVMATGATDAGAVWDVEDDQLLAAARRLIERNCVRGGKTIEHSPGQSGNPKSDDLHTVGNRE